MVAQRIDTRYDYVPTELKNQKQWARYDKINGRDKWPVNLDGSVMYWAKNPESKLTFDQVAHFDKIGCFHTLESGIVGVDYDGCIDEQGNIHPLVLSWIKNTYAEISPNGKGVKAWFKGTIPNGKSIKYNKDSKHFTEDVPWSNPNNSHTGIEIYAQKRFFTITGNIVPGCPSKINEAPDVINELVEKYAPKPKEKKKVEPKEKIKSDNLNFDSTGGYWDLPTWKAWCFKHLEVHNEGDDYLDITCPWSHLHTTPGDNARIYFGPPHTVHCFHAHCDGREWRDVRLVCEPHAYDWQHKQSRSKEESIKHLPSYPQISMEEQMKAINAATSTIEPAIREHYGSNDGTALCISFPQGTGKTHVTAEFVKREKGNIITAWMSPTKEVAYSVPALRDIYHIQACNKKNCPDGHSLHHPVGAKGYNTRKSVHKHHDCDYKEQPFEGETVVFNQQYYNSKYPSSHELVINDESTLPDWLPEQKITIPALQKVNKWKAPGSEEDHFLRAVQATMTDLVQSKPVHGKPIFDRLNKDGQLVNWLGALMGRYTKLRPPTDVDLDNDELDELNRVNNKPDVILPHLIKALCEELVKWQTGKEWNSRISIRCDSSGEVALYIVKPRQMLAPKGEQFPPFVHLDGSIDEEIHSKLFGRELKILRAQINPAPGTYHAAVRDNNIYGKTAHTKEHKDNSPNKTRAATIKKAKYMLKKFNPDGNKKVALISHMECVDEIAEALDIPEDKTGYYWNIRGSNSLEKCDILLLIGTPILNPQTVLTMARSLYFDDPDPISEEWTREDGYKDPRLKHLAQFLTNSELTQAAHRVRPIRYENKTIISFCEGEIEYLPINETFTSLPYMTEEGENLYETKKNDAQDKIKTAYEELSKEGNCPTTEDVRKKAQVGRNKVVEWMKNNVQENKSTAGSMTIDYIDPAVPCSEVPKGQSMYESIPRYKGIEKDAPVITPLGQGTVISLLFMREKKTVSIFVATDYHGWKRFDWKDVKPIIKATQEPLPDAGFDALFAGIC